jgi:hypothetical protein
MQKLAARARVKEAPAPKHPPHVKVPANLCTQPREISLSGVAISELRCTELMHHGSEIMIKAMLSCLEQGVVVLPIHDGLLVAEPYKEIARTA